MAATLGAVALAGALVRWARHGWHVQHAVHIGVYAVILTGLIARRRIPRTARVAILLGAGWHRRSGAQATAGSDQETTSSIVAFLE